LRLFACELEFLFLQAWALARKGGVALPAAINNNEGETWKI
jgi:hypothetical protein